MTPRALVVIALVGALVLKCPATLAAGRVFNASANDYLELLKKLQPGDTLQLAAGEYRRGLPIHHMRGTSALPIVIRGPEGAKPAVFVARADANTVSILESAHVHIRDLTIDGRNVPVDAVKAEGHSRWAHHITLENLTIINHGANQQIVGISTKCPAWGWVVRGNRIHGAGTGMYFGNSDGGGAFFDALVEHNLVTDPLGYAIQIKHQHSRPPLVIAPRGRFVTIIRHNVLSKSRGGSPGALARPNLLVGHWPLSGEGVEDEYLIYGNFLYDNPHEALFQGEGNIAMYNNLFINPRGPGVHVQPHYDVPRTVRIMHNTFVTSGDPLVVRLSETPPSRAQFVAANALFAPRPAQGGNQSGNLAFALDQVSAMLAASNDASTPIDPYPRNDRLRCEAPDRQLLAGLPEATCDFNGVRREQGYCGAYAGNGRNPGWTPSLSIKPSARCVAR
jgi:hypothetical protein